MNAFIVCGAITQRACVLGSAGHNGSDGVLELSAFKRKKWRDVAHNPWVSLVVDDLLPPWRPRFIEIRGQAERRDTPRHVAGDRRPRVRPWTAGRWPGGL